MIIWNPLKLTCEQIKKEFIKYEEERNFSFLSETLSNVHYSCRPHQLFPQNYENLCFTLPLANDSRNYPLLFWFLFAIWQFHHDFCEFHFSNFQFIGLFLALIPYIFVLGLAYFWYTWFFLSWDLYWLQ